MSASPASGSVRTAEFRNYRLECVFGRMTAAQEAEVIEFWRANQAIRDESQARARAREVAWVARDGQGEIAALCTLYTDGFGNPSRPYYYYRMFIRPADRGSGLAVEMVRLTRVSLAADHRPSQPEQGLIIVAENPMFRRPGIHGLFTKWGWTHEGQTEYGHDIWRLDYGNMAPPASPD